MTGMIIFSLQKVLEGLLWALRMSGRMCGDSTSMWGWPCGGVSPGGTTARSSTDLAQGCSLIALGLELPCLAKAVWSRQSNSVTLTLLEMLGSFQDEVQVLSPKEI